ncbi:MAG TPA: gluconate 2-dehydrogenase subunit 3 family protein [Steroidobacteraceae bacterium]|nr:gluconate 2-dehydrogenase subunit 3 family protein [Steroidobacteraceae bacterium]
MDRRTTIKWMLAAAAAVPGLDALAYTPEPQARDVAANQAGYGTDPALMKEWRPGGPWPLTLGVAARLTTAALCDLIIPADELSPSASSVGVVDFIDEWISAPYPQQRGDRAIILPGLTWIEAEAKSRFDKIFAALESAQREAIANDICSPGKAAPNLATAAKFFAKFRDLTAGGFYTTPVGMKDIGYVGNVPLAKFDGPPPEVLKKVGLV